MARMFCDVLTPEGHPYEGDPRHVLRRAVQRAESMGFDHYYVGPELEYFYFKDSKSTEVLDEGGYFDLTTLDAGSDLRRETVLALEQLGIQHRVHPSRGRPEPARDRHEVRGRDEDGRRLHDLPDHGQGIRDEVRLPRDLHAQAAVRAATGPACTRTSRCSAASATRSSMPTIRTSSRTSAKAFIAGQLRHAREICAVFAQWVNSYKRLVPGYEAPVYVAWSRRNRSALVRVPLYHPGKERATRVELTCPDPACNPYLTFAVLLQAGLEGIEHGYELPEAMEKNLYNLAADERRRLGIEQLPENLGEAVELTSQSEIVLRTFGEHIFNRYIEIKRREWDDYRVQVTPWELERYLPVL